LMKFLAMALAAEFNVRPPNVSSEPRGSQGSIYRIHVGPRRS